MVIRNTFWAKACLITLIGLMIQPVFAETKTYFIHNDHLGTPQVVTDKDKKVVWQAHYKPFGEIAAISENQVRVTSRFPGQYFDSETGLHYNYFRDYDPSLGRYIQSDPRGVMLDYSDPRRMIAARMGIPITSGNGKNPNHLYGYADQNPLALTDRTGEAAAAAAGLCFIPGVGWVGCGAAAAGVAGVGLICYLTGACQDFAQACYDAFSSESGEDDDGRCDEMYAVDTSTCNGISRIRGREAGAACHASASERYGACLAGRPIPPLNTWNN